MTDLELNAAFRGVIERLEKIEERLCAVHEPKERKEWIVRYFEPGERKFTAGPFETENGAITCAKTLHESYIYSIHEITVTE